ncbi:MAG: hypothetical protein HS100_22425 [Anaerolineales bacterium]|nr:hypothetical protein [Anaerolineales bacterium]
MMIRDWAIYRIAITGVLGALLFGCIGSTPTPASVITPSPEQMDKSLFTGIPCSAPCWQGLEVGESSESDVTSILPTLTFIDHKEIQIFQVSMPNYDFSASAPGVLIEANCINSNQICLTLAVIDDILTKIVVGFNYKITQDEVVKFLGEPDYIGFGNLGSERVMCEVYLVWMNSRLVLASRFEDLEQAEKYCYIVDEEGRAPSNLLILEARYLSEAELNAYLSSISSKFFEFTGAGPDK